MNKRNQPGLMVRVLLFCFAIWVLLAYIGLSSCKEITSESPTDSVIGG